MKDKFKVVKELKSFETKKILLAADPDREGESIAYHLAYVLGLKLSENNRITFNEITKNAILKAVSTPRKVDINLVNAYQARRVLDRVVGYKLSPILCKIFSGKLSAGRVQSVALRIIVEREKDITSFVPEENFIIDGTFNKSGAFGLSGRLDKEYSLTKDAKKILEHCKDAVFKIASITPSESIRNPPAPFTTSSLQQDAGAKFGFSTKQTMDTAQKLYEAGKITYMRTDSTHLSEEALEEIKKVIIEKYTDNYLNIKQYKTKSKNAQEAHEAIRPTHFEENELSDDSFDEYQKKLYSLIWKRTVASQMKSCIMSVLTICISISNASEKFISRLQKVKFDGYTILYQETSLEDEPEEDTNNTWGESLKVGDKLQRDVITATQKESKPPGRFTEPTLVKRLEEKGIGRPSTYASIISTIIERNYVKKMNIPGVKKDIIILTLKKMEINEKKKNITIGSEKSKLVPTPIGQQVSIYLTEKFPEIMDYSFTANVEKELDNITKGKIEWEKVVDKTWSILKDEIDKSSTNIVRELGTDTSGNKVFARITKNGPALQIDKKFRSITQDEYEKITLSEALKKFEEGFPKELTPDITIHQGQYGYYLKSGGKNFSIESPEITLEEAKKIIQQLIIKVGKKSYQLLNGKYGWYLKDGKNNISLPENIREKCPNITSDDILQVIKKESK
jgi:DNA topoisomerase-1